MKGSAYPREARVGACADYLLGLPMKVINHKWGLTLSSSIVHLWIKRAGFKSRVKRR